MNIFIILISMVIGIIITSIIGYYYERNKDKDLMFYEGNDMKVKDYINRNKWKNIKYNIDNIVYESEEYIPEDILNTEVKSYIYHMVDEMILILRTDKTHRYDDCYNFNW